MTSRIVLLAEPTLGVDVGARAAVHGYLQRLRDRGVGVVLASSDLFDEVAEIADCVIVLARERIVGTYSGGAASRAAILHAAAA